MRKHLLLACPLLALGACSTKDAAAPSRQALLTARPWRITAHSLSSTSADRATGATTTVTTDAYALTPPCAQDDFYTFNADNTLVIEEGASKCSPTLPQSRTYTWYFADSQRQLRVTKADKATPETDEILELSATTLRIRTTSIGIIGTVEVATITCSALYAAGNQ